MKLSGIFTAVRRRLEQISNDHDLFGSQYNILRILAGGPPEGYPRQEIIDRMIDRSPDVTRLADDLEEKGLITRERSQEDRRVILHPLTSEGRRLEAVTEDLRPVHRAFSDELTHTNVRLRRIPELSQAGRESLKESTEEMFETIESYTISVRDRVIKLGPPKQVAWFSLVMNSTVGTGQEEVHTEDQRIVVTVICTYS